jgi:hypothetical protein
MKKYVYLCLCLLTALAFNSCEDDESPMPQPESDYTHIDIVTGIRLFDANGSAIGQWRSPNDNTGEISAFPNPNIGTLLVISPQDIVRIVLVPANCLLDSTTENIPILSESLEYSEEELEVVKIKDLPIMAGNNQLALDFTDVPPNFYRLFVQVAGGVFFWQNLYIDPSANNVPSLEVLDTACE